MSFSARGRVVQLFETVGAEYPGLACLSSCPAPHLPRIQHLNIPAGSQLPRVCQLVRGPGVLPHARRAHHDRGGVCVRLPASGRHGGGQGRSSCCESQRGGLGMDLKPVETFPRLAAGCMWASCGQGHAGEVAAEGVAGRFPSASPAGAKTPAIGFECKPDVVSVAQTLIYCRAVHAGAS